MLFNVTNLIPFSVHVDTVRQKVIILICATFFEQPRGILTRDFVRVSPIDGYVKMPMGISFSLTATKLLNFSCNYVVISERRTILDE